MIHNSENILIQKLDEFIRKYYKNEIIRGSIFFTAAGVAFFLTAAALEYFGRFGTTSRTVLFYALICSFAVILFKWIIGPALKLKNLGKRITNEQAARIIGNHFPQINDKLLNILQLSDLQISSGSTELIKASIDQKTAELRPVPFTNAIDLGSNKKYLKYALPPLAILLISLLVSPEFITGSTKRIIEHNTHFEAPAPFTFHLNNKDLKAIQQEDFTLDISVTGKEIPAEVFVRIGSEEFRLSKEKKNAFRHIFRNIQKSVSFTLFADGINSRQFTLEVIPRPVLLSFSVQLDYPDYTGKKDETLRNTGDLTIPEGTKAKWLFSTQNTAGLSMKIADSVIHPVARSADEFEHQKRIFKSFEYSVSTSNSYLRNADSVKYSVNVVPDQYPTIEAEGKRDSLSDKRHYFRGKVSDDYGFTGLTFSFTITPEEDSARPYSQVVDVPFSKGVNTQMFYHFWDLSMIQILPGDKVEYFFEVWDNDGVHGRKSTRSKTMFFKAPTLKELAKNTEKANEKIKGDLKESIKDAKDLQKEIAELNRKMLEKKTLSWDEKKKLQDIVEKQKALEKQLDQLKNENQQNNTRQNEFQQQNEEIAQKQQQLQELFEKVMTPEMKQMIQNLEKMMENFDKDKAQQMLEKMKFDAKDLEKELDRNLELFKQLELEQKFNQTKENLDKLAEKQEELSKKAEEKNADSKDLEKKQDALNKEFSDLKEEMKKLEEMNKELGQDLKLEETKDKQDKISEEMKNSSSDLQNGKPKKASPKQKQAADDMKELSEKMSEMQAAMEQEDNGEDMNALRQILENLLKLSFDQEELIKKTNTTDRSNPQYVKLGQIQKKLKDDAKMIEDSLFALSKRQIQIESFVNKEIAAINSSMEKSIKSIEDRQPAMAANRQQYAMTGINNLALMLSESLEQMQKQQQQQAKKKNKGGGGSCSKPGGSSSKPKPSMSTLKQMQKQLNDQMQQLMEGMKNGKGQKQGEGSKMSEELAKLAAQQAAIRQMVQDAANQMIKDGQNSKSGSNGQDGKDGKNGNAGQLQKLAEQMDKTETDLVNRRLTQETLKRQQEILTRLLESEKAEKEREQDHKRKSEEAKNEYFSNPKQFLEYNTQKQKEIELLRTVPPALNPFYKSKVNEYFNQVNVR